MIEYCTILLIFIVFSKICTFNHRNDENTYSNNSLKEIHRIWDEKYRHNIRCKEEAARRHKCYINYTGANLWRGGINGQMFTFWLLRILWTHHTTTDVANDKYVHSNCHIVLEVSITIKHTVKWYSYLLQIKCLFYKDIIHYSYRIGMEFKDMWLKLLQRI